MNNKIKKKSVIEIFANADPNQCFTLLLHHLLENGNNEGPFIFLLNKLYSVDLDIIEFFLPQLINIYLNRIEVKTNSQAFEKFLLTKSAESFHFATLVRWFSESEVSKKGLSSFLHHIEHATLKEVTSVNMSSGSDDMTTPLFEIDEFEKVMYRNEYSTCYNNVLYFVNFLTDLSYRLFNLSDSGMRKTKLKVELEQFNKILPTFSSLYYPVIENSSESPFCEIVGIIGERCFALETKARVSLLMLVEVLEYPNRDFKVPFLKSNGNIDDFHFVDVTQSHKEVNNNNNNNLQDKEKELSSVIIAEKEEDEEEGGGKEEGRKEKEDDDDDNEEEEEVVVVEEEIILEEEKEEEIESNEEEKKKEESKEREREGETEEKEKTKEPEMLKKHLSFYDLQDDFVFVRSIEEDEIRKLKKARMNELLDPVFGPEWKKQKQALRYQSSFGQLPNWNLRSFIVKSNDDLRQEHLTMQFIRLFKKIWIEENKLPVHLTPYTFIVTSEQSGLVETIKDAVSLDNLMKKYKGWKNLLSYFVDVYGATNSSKFKAAQRNFIESLSANSILCYILQIKDRHNGNLMLTRSGHLVHIDFGFLLGNAPGNVNFESAPFKLTREFAEVIGGTTENPLETDSFRYFRVLLYYCLETITRRENAERIIHLLSSLTPMALKYPCLSSGFLNNFKNVMEMLKKRLLWEEEEEEEEEEEKEEEKEKQQNEPNDNCENHEQSKEEEKKRKNALREEKVAQICKDIVNKSYMNSSTKTYDQFQYFTNGIRYGD